MVERTKNNYGNPIRQLKRCALCNAEPGEQPTFIYLEVVKGFSGDATHEGWFCSVNHMLEKRKQWKEGKWRQDVLD